MKELVIKTSILDAQMEDLTDAEQALVEEAIEGTNRSYAPLLPISCGCCFAIGKREDYHRVQSRKCGLPCRNMR